MLLNWVFFIYAIYFVSATSHHKKPKPNNVCCNPLTNQIMTQDKFLTLSKRTSKQNYCCAAQGYNNFNYFILDKRTKHKKQCIIVPNCEMATTTCTSTQPATYTPPLIPTSTYTPPLIPTSTYNPPLIPTSTYNPPLIPTSTYSLPPAYTSDFQPSSVYTSPPAFTSDPSTISIPKYTPTTVSPDPLVPVYTPPVISSPAPPAFTETPPTSVYIPQCPFEPPKQSDTSSVSITFTPAAPSPSIPRNNIIVSAAVGLGDGLFAAKYLVVFTVVLFYI
jgi:hypothetical protein